MTPEVSQVALAADPVGLAKEFITLYGPLGFGWILSAYLLWRKRVDDGITREAFKEIVNGYHAAVLENTKVVERWTTMLDERLRRAGS